MSDYMSDSEPYDPALPVAVSFTMFNLPVFPCDIEQGHHLSDVFALRMQVLWSLPTILIHSHCKGNEP